jgi:hypothetical protein
MLFYGNNELILPQSTEVQSWMMLGMVLKMHTMEDEGRSTAFFVQSEGQTYK